MQAQVITYYISNEVVSGADGSYDKPYFFKWESIIQQVKRVGSLNDFVLVFKEDEYFVTDYGYGVTFTNKNSGNINSITIKAEDGKRVKIHCGIRPGTWRRSKLNERFWEVDVNENTKIYGLIVNDKRAVLARVPSSKKYARTIDYESETDPTNSSRLIRSFKLQEDCIKLLSLVNEEELQNAYMVDLHYWTYSREKIISLDKKNQIIKTRVDKSEDSSFGIGKVRKGDFYHIENILAGLNEPGEYFVFPNNTIIYYAREGEDMKTTDSYLPYGGIGIHSTIRPNVTIMNIDVVGATNAAFRFTNIDSLDIINCTARHSEQGIFVGNSNNVLIDHNLVEDIGGYGMNIRANDYITVHNNIVRGYGRTSYKCHGMWFYETSNNTVISNNDIGDGYHSPIQIFHKYSMINSIHNDILVRDNHCHHAGLGLLDDMGGITALFVALGTVIEHNHCHDIFSPNYCGGCFLTGSGSYGIILRNNLAYNASHNAIKFDHGAEITLENNIMGYNCYEGVLTYTNNKPGYHQWSIFHNIFIFSSTIMMGAFDNSEAENSIDKNIYWHIDGEENINFRKKSWEEWKKNRGYDHNSYIIDPLFVSPDNVDYNFINDSSYKKIDFKPFDFEFGVTGEDWWIEKAKDYEFYSLYEIPDEWQFEEGFEDFEGGKGNSEMWKVATISDENKVQISNENYHCRNKEDECKSGYSLKFSESKLQSSAETRPRIIIPVDWYDGNAEISFDLFIGSESSLAVYFGDASNFDMFNGELTFFRKKYLKFKTNEWIKVSIFVTYGSARNDDNSFSCEIGGEKVERIPFRTSFKKTSEIIFMNVESNEPIYIDNIYLNIDKRHVKYFETELEKTNELTDLYKSSEETPSSTNDFSPVESTTNQIDLNSPTPNNNTNVNGDGGTLPGGAIAGIVIAVIVVVAAAIVGVIFYLRKKNNDPTSDVNLEM